MSGTQRTDNSRRTHGGLSESARRPHSLKWNWKWSTEVELEREVKTFMAESSSNRPSAQCARGDDLDMTFEQGEAR